MKGVSAPPRFALAFTVQLGHPGAVVYRSPALIPQETIDLIRANTDISEVIGERIDLRNGRSALCPFHDDRQPSFSINQARQTYHCFGCGTSGDAFAFVMAYDRVNFFDAAKALGERVGIPVGEELRLTREQVENRRRSRSLSALYDAMKCAASFYSRQLDEPAGAPAREYLAARGISPEVADAFGLGYAPAAWQTLTGVFKDCGVTATEGQDVDLLVARPNSVGRFDRLRDRIVFPIYDREGRAQALIGRALPGAPLDTPKYLITANSLIYAKTQSLYALPQATCTIEGGEPPVLVEGSVDAVALHAHGFRSTLAAMGTALSSSHVVLLSIIMGTNRDLVILFDGDDAGRRGAESAKARLANMMIKARVAKLLEGYDPDRFVRRFGAEALGRVISAAGE